VKPLPLQDTLGATEPSRSSPFMLSNSSCAAQVLNSRMCQLVLGAGAMASAGLRSITAKHLALSAQAAGAHVHLRSCVLRLRAAGWVDVR
jgi:Vps54-like protein